jgi:hypothetical protein
VKLKHWFQVEDTTKQSKQVRQEVTEIEKGIYSDKQGAMYEVIGTATHTERSESLVVYR